MIRVNGETADIYSQVHNGDRIQVTTSTAGEAASMELGRLPEMSEKLRVCVNDMGIDLPRTALVNGQLENEFYSIQENDDITVKNYYTVREIAEFMDVPLGGKITVNDIPANTETRVYENFTLCWNPDAELTYEELEGPEEEEKTTVVEQDSMPGQNPVPEQHPESEQTDDADHMIVIVNNAPTVLFGKNSYVFVDVFSFINFDLKSSQGRTIVTKLNGRDAEYMEPLSEGDKIEIYWKDNKTDERL